MSETLLPSAMTIEKSAQIPEAAPAQAPMLGSMDTQGQAPGQNTILSPVLSQPMTIMPTDLEALPVLRPVEGVPFGLKLLSSIAAFKGDFGPIMQLKHMERKGEAYNTFLQSRRDVNQLILGNKEDKAYEVLREAGTRAMAIAPELAPMVQTDLDRVYNKQAVRAQAENLANAIEMNVSGGKINPAQIESAERWVQALRTFGSKARNADELKTYLDTIGVTVHPAPNQNAMILADKSGALRQVQLNEAFSEQELKGPVGSILSSQTGLTTAELTNIMNGRPVMRGSTNITPELQPFIRETITKLSGVVGQRELVKDVPYSPEQNQAMRETLKAKGIPDAVANLIMSTRGAVTPEQTALMTAQQLPIAEATTGLERAGRETVAAERERLAEVPFKVQESVAIENTPAGAQYSIIGRDENNPSTYGIPLRAASIAQVKANPDKMVIVSNKDRDEIITPGLRVISGLDKAISALETLGSPDDLISRAASGVQSLIADYIGTNDPLLTKAAAAKAIAHQALEEMRQTTKIASTDTARMARFIEGRMAGVSGSTAAVRELQGRMVTLIDAAMGKSNEEAIRAVQSVRRVQEKQAVLKTQRQLAPQGPSRVTSSILSLIEGVDDLNTPAQQSRNWEQVSKDIAVEGEVTVRDIAKVLAIERAEVLRKKGIKTYKDTLILDTDDKATAMKKLAESEAMLSVSKGKPRGIVKYGE